MTDLFLEVVGLKDVARAGWLRAGIPSPESVAAHSWGVAWLVLALLPPDLDLRRALVYAVLHDLPEVRTGDLTPQDGVPAAEKHARERAAMEALCARLPTERGEELRRAWEAYEAQADDEARFVRDLDRLDMAIQAVAYAPRAAGGTLGFLESAAARITHASLRPILAVLAERLAEEQCRQHEPVEQGEE